MNAISAYSIDFLNFLCWSWYICISSHSFVLFPGVLYVAYFDCIHITFCVRSNYCLSAKDLAFENVLESLCACVSVYDILLGNNSTFFYKSY